MRSHHPPLFHHRHRNRRSAGTGGDISSFISYNEAKRWSKHKEKFGDGAPEGICAPEAGNNAVSAAP